MPAKSILARFGFNVRNLRNGLGISQEELAERADLHRTYIAGIERGGRNITLKSMQKLALALEVSLEALLNKASEWNAFPRNSRLNSNGLVEVLLVEDDLDDVTLTLHAFREVHFTNHVNVVRDGAEALDYLFCQGKYAGRGARVAPHVVLLDLELPKIRGLEVLRRIKANAKTSTIPVIVLSASKKNADIAESRDLGAATYIIKPVDFLNFSQATSLLSLQWALLEQESTD